MAGDLSNYTDAQLAAMYPQPAPIVPQIPADWMSGAPKQAAPATPDLSKLSDADLAAMYPAQHPTSGASGDIWTDIPRWLGTGAVNAVSGLMGPLARADTGVPTLTVRPTGAMQVNEQPPPTPAQGDANVAAMRNNLFNTTGGTEYEPSTMLGRMGLSALSTAMLAPLGAASADTIPAAFGRTAVAIPAAAASGAGSQFGAERMPGHPNVGAVLGGLPGAALGAVPTRLAVAMGNGPMTEPYGAFTRLGLPTDLTGTTTGAPALQFAEKFARRMPGSEGAVADATNNLTQAWRDKLNSVGDSLGTATTPSEVGQSLQSAAGQWLTDFKAQSAKNWNDYYSKVPPNTPYAVNGYDAALKKTLGTFPGAPETGSILQPGTLKSLSDALGVDLSAGGGALPAQTVHAMRTAIGEKIENPTTIPDTSQGALRQLYGGLTNDIEAGAAAQGPAALSAFYKANAATAAGHDLLDNHISPIIKAPSPEAATQYAMQQARLGGSRLGALTLNLPGAAGDLGSYALRNAATNIESPTRFATSMTGAKPIYSQEAQNVLFPQSGTQADIADLATAGNAMQPLAKDINNSVTATHNARGLGRLIAAQELARQGHDIAGVPGAIGGGLLGLGAPEALGKAAQLTALNPSLAALYGRQMPSALTVPSPLARAMLGPALQRPGPWASVPATTPNSGPQQP